MSRIEISPEWLAGLKELAEKATPGPWIMGEDGGVYSEARRDIPVDIIDGLYTEAPDAAFIAAASPDVVLGLIERIGKLEKEADWLAERLKKVCNAYDMCGMANESCPFDGEYRCYSEDLDWREAARNAIAQGNANDRQ